MKLFALLVLVGLGAVNARRPHILRSKRAISFESKSYMKKTQTLIQQEYKTSSTIQQKVSQRFEQQDSQWSEQVQESQQMQTQIQSSSQSQEVTQQFQQDQQEIQHAQRVNDQAQDQIQGKLEQVRSQIQQLEANHQQVLSRQSQMSQEEFTEYEENFTKQQSELNVELKGLMQVGKKAERASNFAQEQAAQLKDAWANHPSLPESVRKHMGNTKPAGPKEQWDKKRNMIFVSFKNFNNKWDKWSQNPQSGKYNVQQGAKATQEHYAAAAQGQVHHQQQSQAASGQRVQHQQSMQQSQQTQQTEEFNVEQQSQQYHQQASQAKAEFNGKYTQKVQKTASLHGGDAFWSSLTEMWRKEVGAFFAEMLGRFKTLISNRRKLQFMKANDMLISGEAEFTKSGGGGGAGEEEEDEEGKYGYYYQGLEFYGPDAILGEY